MVVHLISEITEFLEALTRTTSDGQKWPQLYPAVSDLADRSPQLITTSQALSAELAGRFDTHFLMSSKKSERPIVSKTWRQNPYE